VPQRKRFLFKSSLHAEVEQQLRNLFLALETEAEATDEGQTGPCLQRLLTTAFLTNTAKGLLPNQPPGCRGAWLEFLLQLVQRLPQPILVYEVMLQVLHITVKTCSHTQTQLTEEEKHVYVLLLCGVLRRVERDPSLLPLMLDVRGKQSFPALDALLPYMRDVGALGSAAREALLIGCLLTGAHRDLATYLAEKTAFAAHVAGGLAACYSMLPMALPTRAKKSSLRAWAHTADQLAQRVPNAEAFFAALDFCAKVLDANHPDIREHIVDQVGSPLSALLQQLPVSPAPIPSSCPCPERACIGGWVMSAACRRSTAGSWWACSCLRCTSGSRKRPLPL
jgi:hypothetical protein